MLNMKAALALMTSAAMLLSAANSCKEETPTKRPSTGCKPHLVTDVQFHGNPDFTADIFFNAPDCKSTQYARITQEEYNISTCWTNGDHYYPACLNGD